MPADHLYNHNYQLHLSHYNPVLDINIRLCLLDITESHGSNQLNYSLLLLYQ